MQRRVAIIGIGYTPFRPITPELSFKEMMFEAAQRAYEDAGVCPRRDIDAFVTCEEDFTHGRSIFNIHMPDNIGAVLKRIHTLPADGIYGLADAYMLINTGLVDVMAVESHSKASNMLTPNYLVAHAMDPVYNKPLAYNPYFIAGMEMNRFLCETGTTEEQCALVAVKNKANALLNPQAAYGDRITLDDVLDSEMMFHPLSRLEMSAPADGGIVMVLACEEKAYALSDRPVWVRGVGWCSDAPSLETRDWGKAVYAQLAGDMAYRVAGIGNPRLEIDFAEVDDTFAYKELQHLEALRLCRPGEAGLMVEEGGTLRDSELPVNVSGGSLGVGRLDEATGLQKVLEVVIQLRGEAGSRQLDDVQVGLAQSWRGLPANSGAVAILSNE
ncbi:MAG: acetyl-CoA acetyltransferase [Dehalococcoidia bacterium]|nr:acetyl-CoA acetyltransferase [Dehalococcoidia bacterium]